MAGGFREPLMTADGPPSDKSKWIGRLPLILAGGAVAVSMLAVGWLILRPSAAPPEAQLQTALAKLDASKDAAPRDSARRIAEHVLHSGFRDPAFPGKAEFILGIAA